MKTLLLNKYLIVLISSFLFACSGKKSNESIGDGVELIGKSKYRWTDIAVTNDNRIFVCFPREMNKAFYSLGEVTDGRIEPFPDKHINHFDKKHLNDKFINVTDVIYDENGFIWALDAASISGVLVADPVLYKINIEDEAIAKKYIMDSKKIGSKAFLSCMDIDFTNNYAYLSNSGDGAIIVLNLLDGKSWSRLSTHPSMMYISDSRDTTSKIARFNSIGLSMDKRFLYYTSLTNFSIYKVSANALRNRDILDYEMDFFVTYIGKLYYTYDLMFYNSTDFLIGDAEDLTLKMVCKKSGPKDLITIKKPELPGYFDIDTIGNVYLTTIIRDDNSEEKVSLYKIRANCKNDFVNDTIVETEE